MALVDQYGNPIRKAELKRELMTPTLTGVLSSRRQYESSGIDPQRLALLLREAEHDDPTKYLEFAEDMEEKDPHYLSVLNTRKRQVSQLTVTVDPADDSAEAEADAALVREWLQRDEVEDELYDMLDAIAKGFSVMEIIWDTSEGQWMPERLEYRLPTWFRYDPVSSMNLERRGEHGQWVDLEPGKFIVHRGRAKSGIPIRGGIARAVCWWWLFKNFGTRDWLRFIEVYGHPLRVGKYEKGSTAEEREVLLRAVRNIASDAAAIIPASMIIEFIENTGTGVRAELYLALLRYVDASYSKVLLGQTLTTETSESGGGAHALGQIHNEVREDIEKSDAKQLGATLSRSLGRPIVQLNRGSRKLYPRVRIGREARGDPALLAEALSKLLPYGLKVKASEIRERLDLAEPGPEDEVLTDRAGTPPGGNTESVRALFRALANRRGRGGDDVDAAVEALLAGNGWEPIMDPVIEPVLAAASAAVARGESLQDFRARLPELFSAMDDAELVRTLGRMGFSARLSGHAGLGGRE